VLLETLAKARFQIFLDKVVPFRVEQDVTLRCLIQENKAINLKLLE
jgi:hypothetical protein